MNINLHNYEEYFILYLDNELSGEDRRMVESFIQKNPDLKEELNILFQSRLVADNNIVFENKEDLLKSSQVHLINQNNFEEWLVLYLDNELPEKERSFFENFVGENPAVRKELEIFTKTKLQPDNRIFFPDKKSLYRREREVPVIPIKWRRIAAAAVLLLAISITAILVINKPSISSGSATQTITQTNLSPEKENPVITNSKDINQVIQQTPVVSNKETIAASTKKLAAIKNTDIKEKEDLNHPAIGEEKNLAVTFQNPTNNLPVPNTYGDRPEILKDVTNNTLKNEVTPTRQNNIDLPVTTNVADTYITYKQDTPKEDDNIIYASEQGDSKNKLRGFFRKVTRVFERNTNISATDEDNRLLIGGFAVKLK